MLNSLQRFLYQLLLRLHPPAFQREFRDEMLWVFDELADERGALNLLLDAFSSLTRQWVVRSFLQKLLLGDIGLSPARSLAAGLFTWERIGFPERPLPVPRIVQGSVASFAFIVSLSVLGLGTGNAAEFYSVPHAARSQACAPRADARELSNARLGRRRRPHERAGKCLPDLRSTRQPVRASAIGLHDAARLVDVPYFLLHERA